MTVAEIKEFVDTIRKHYVMGMMSLDSQIIHELKQILSMLDELEPKAKWVASEKPNHFECSNCGNKRVIKTKYCSNCGARMNDKLKENNK